MAPTFGVLSSLLKVGPLLDTYCKRGSQTRHVFKSLHRTGTSDQNRNCRQMSHTPTPGQVELGHRNGVALALMAHWENPEEGEAQCKRRPFSLVLTL